MCGAVSETTAFSKPGTCLRMKAAISATWRRPSSMASLTSRSRVPSLPRMRVVLKFHSPARGLGEASTSSRGTVISPAALARAQGLEKFQSPSRARMTRGVSTPVILKIIVMGCAAPSFSRPCAKGTPARAHTSPSPEASMIWRARMTARPSFDSMMTPASRSPSRTTSANWAKNNGVTPAPTTMRSSTTLIASLS